MTGFFTATALIVGVLIVLALVQGARGPTIFDRVVSAAMAAANGIVLLLLIGMLFERLEAFVDIAIAYALLAFLFPLALAKYFERFGNHVRRPSRVQPEEARGRDGAVDPGPAPRREAQQ